jgi:hypothetical protein
MVALFIFFIHFVGALYAFARSYCDHKLGDAFMAVAFVAIIFSVGWTIAAFVVRFFFPIEGFGPFLDRDTISLVIVTLLEAVLYLTYFRTAKKKKAKLAAG